MPPDGGPPRRDYRPDLRPMLILALVLAAVLLGWIMLGPLLLPTV